MSNFTRNAKRSADSALHLGLLLAGVAAGPVQADSLGFEQGGEVPVVIAATRLQQSLLDAPASVTVIDRALIRASGARELPDILRLVPGMVVGRESAGEAYVSYHGTASFGGRRMQVQVDGRSIYQAGLALVDWIGLPLDIEDIERVEVVRGPDSAAYGANSFLGVINIITRHPQDVPNAEVMVRGGENGVADAFGRLSLHGLGADWAWSLFHREDDGYDINLKRDNRPYVDDMVVDGAYGKGVWHTPRDGQVTLSLGGSRMAVTEERLNDTSIYRQVPVVTRDTAYAALDWEQPWAASHKLQVKLNANWLVRDEPWYVRIPYLAVSPELGAFWREDKQLAEDFVDDPVSACTGSAVLTNSRLRALCLRLADDDYTRERDYTTDQNSEETRSEIEISDTWVPHPRLRLVAGVQGMYAEVTSRTFLNGTASNTVLSAFGHGELRLADAWLLNVGGNVEDDEYAGRFFSPRAALSWRFRPEQVLRLVHSRAVRTPDIFESQADWHYYATTDDRSESAYDGAYYLSAKSDGKARTEHIRSNELSYYGSFQRFQLDVRLFRDELDLVNNRLEIDRFLLSEHEHFLMKGGEVGATWQLTPFQRVLLNYARLSMSSATVTDSDNMDLVPRHSGSLTWARLDPDGWRASATYGFYNDLNRELFFDRLDVHMGRVLPVGNRQQLDLGVTAQIRLSDDPELRSINGVESRHKIWATAAWRY